MSTVPLTRKEESGRMKGREGGLFSDQSFDRMSTARVRKKSQSALNIGDGRA